MIDWTNLDDGTEPIYRANLLEYAEEKSLLNNLIDLCYSTGRIDSAVRQQLLLMVAERQYLTAYQMMSLIDGIMTRTGMLDEYKHLSEEAIEFLKGIVFVATYNETPFTEVVDAANAGKIVMVKKDGIQYYLSQLSNTVAYFYQTIGSNIYRVFVYSTDVWSTGTTSLVPSTLKVNNKQLNQDINLTASDVGARPDTWTPSASDVGAVPTTRTVNSKALSSDINLTASDVGAIAQGNTGAVLFSGTQELGSSWVTFPVASSDVIAYRMLAVEGTIGGTGGSYQFSTIIPTILNQVFVPIANYNSLEILGIAFVSANVQMKAFTTSGGTASATITKIEGILPL